MLAWRIGMSAMSAGTVGLPYAFAPSARCSPSDYRARILWFDDGFLAESQNFVSDRYARERIIGEPSTYRLLFEVSDEDSGSDIYSLEYISDVYLPTMPNRSL